MEYLSLETETNYIYIYQCPWAIPRMFNITAFKRSGKRVPWHSKKHQDATQFSLPSRNFSKLSVQNWYCSGSVPLYQIKVLSTLSTGGLGRNPRPTKWIGTGQMEELHLSNFINQTHMHTHKQTHILSLHSVKVRNVLLLLRLGKIQSKAKTRGSLILGCFKRI
jgi:hypothetical protein